MEHTNRGKQHLRVRLSWLSLQLVQYRSNEVYYEENLFYFKVAGPADKEKLSALYKQEVMGSESKSKLFNFHFSFVSFIFWALLELQCKGSHSKSSEVLEAENISLFQQVSQNLHQISFGPTVLFVVFNSNIIGATLQRISPKCLSCLPVLVTGPKYKTRNLEIERKWKHTWVNKNNKLFSITLFKSSNHAIDLFYPDMQQKTRHLHFFDVPGGCDLVLLFSQEMTLVVPTVMFRNFIV